MRDEVLKLLKKLYEKNNIECEIGENNKIGFFSEEDIIASHIIFFNFCLKHDIAKKVADVLELVDKNSVASIGVSSLSLSKEMNKQTVDEILDRFMLEALKDELNV